VTSRTLSRNEEETGGNRAGSKAEKSFRGGGGMGKSSIGFLLFKGVEAVRDERAMPPWAPSSTE